MKFNSQICTTVEQSQRLLSLGLKKETADMVHYFSQSLAQDWAIVPLDDGETARYIQGLEIPAWSLHRLLIIAESDIQTDGVYASLPHIGFTQNKNMFDNIINCIEWLIKKGCFNKKYLEE